MQKIALANTSLAVSPLCFGVPTWGTQISLEAAEMLYGAFRDAGGNFFDTAHCYAFWLPNGGAGSSERALGALVRKHKDRNNTVLATKGGHPSAGPAYARAPQFLSPAQIASDIQDSLGWLGVDAIDLYYLHRDDPRVPVGEIMDALHEHVARGQLRYLGASNWSAERIAAANIYAAKAVKTPFVVNQPMYSLGHPNALGDPTMRYFSTEDYRWHQASGLALCPYSSTANGYFASHGQRAKATFDNPTSRQRLQLAAQMASVKGCTPNQLALAWLRAHPFPVIPIVGTGDLAHLHDAIGAANVKLTEQEFQSLQT